MGKHPDPVQARLRLRSELGRGRPGDSGGLPRRAGHGRPPARRGAAMTLRKLRRSLYRDARILGDVEAVASGSPGKVGKRIVRRKVYRAEGTITRRRTRKFGL